MSHFTVMVIGNEPEKQLKPFDENLETPRYVRYTKQQLIEKGKKRIQDYKNTTYSRFLENPGKYKADCNNQGHIDYLEKEFPKILEWTDDEIHEYEVTNYEDVGLDGEVYSTFNPNSKWDWYSLGGRWSGLLKLKNGAQGKTGSPSLVMKNSVGIDQAKKGDIENLSEITTFAVLKDGKWHERGEMGWWGTVSNEKEEDKWKTEFDKMIQELPDETLISIYDCHI